MARSGERCEQASKLKQADAKSNPSFFLHPFPPISKLTANAPGRFFHATLALPVNIDIGGIGYKTKLG